MNIQITARHVKASQALKDTLSDELEKLEKYSDKITSCHAILDAEHVDKTVEIVLAVRKKSISAKARAESLGKAADLAVDKIRTQLKRSTERRKNHKPRRSNGGEREQPVEEN
ncbi:MAG: ribosome-associated translation inhibitor RaiA [Chitinivibrionales bacterium]|nr:ribosome-associated translation inhibitor RaiA [Chitinivibrionales bacterium]MBD3395903.1 ribosome-associated translation inhibitor RaiA [Chitinivibrionales bacterium]